MAASAGMPLINMSALGLIWWIGIRRLIVVKGLLARFWPWPRLHAALGDMQSLNMASFKVNFLALMLKRHLVSSIARQLLVKIVSCLTMGSNESCWEILQNSCSQLFLLLCLPDCAGNLQLVDPT